MNYKKILKALLFPHIAVMIVLLPVSTVFLVFSMLFMGTESAVAIVSYVLAAYTLAVWCMKIPNLVRSVKRFKNNNKYAQIWIKDTRLRVNVSLYGTLIFNTAYAVLQLGLGLYHATFWFISLAGYYLSLAVMRFYLVRHTSKHMPGEKMQLELIKYRVCGIIFLIMNLTLTLMIFFMVYWNRTFIHHEITTIAMASYTFGALSLAIINAVKYRKYNSPAYSAAKAISLASACVSMITLESTMLTTFGNDTVDLATRRIMVGASGAVISAFIISMAVYMIVKSTKKIRLLKAAKEIANGKQ